MKSTLSLTKALLITAALLLTACATTGPGGKQSLILIPTSQEVAIGQGMAQEIAATENFLPDVVWQEYLDEIGQKIVSVCDRKDIEYHFAVIDSDDINAFAAPGGYIYFYTGLLSKMENEAELASVLAHEISHVVARHGIKRVQTVMGVAVAYDLVFGGEEQSQALNTAIAIGLNLAFASYSRSNEREADEYGMIYMVRAGYDPQGMVTMFEKLAQLGGGGGNIFEQMASSHPETQERIEAAHSRIMLMQEPDTELTLGVDRYQQMLRRLPSSEN